MDAVAILMVGIGAWLMYYAFRNQTPTPVTQVRTSVGGLTGKSS